MANQHNDDRKSPGRTKGGGPPGGSAFARLRGTRRISAESAPDEPESATTLASIADDERPAFRSTALPARPPDSARTFPGGRVRLPRLDSTPAAEPEMQFVGTAFVRAPQDGSVPETSTSYDEYFTFASLFEPSLEAEEESDALAAFDVLGVTPEMPWRDIVSAHRSLVKQHHPDHLADADDETRNLAEERLREINHAYSELNRRRAVS